MKLGYARVSTTDQNLELQTDALKQAGVERFFSDRISGAENDREGLNDLLAVARAGDTVVVWRLDRLARSLHHLIELAAQFESRGIQLHSLTESIDTTTPAGKLFFHIFGAIAEFERNLIRERTTAGLDAARAQGRRGGRRRVLDKGKQKAITTLIDTAKKNGEIPNIKEIAAAVGTSERTARRFYRGEYVSQNGA